MARRLIPRRLGLWLALLIGGAGTAQADLLDPASFASLGAFPTKTGLYLIDTADPTLYVPYASSLDGVVVGNTAVFTFDSITIGDGMTFLVTGPRPLALLSRDGVNISGSGMLNASGNAYFPGQGGPGGGSNNSHSNGAGYNSGGGGFGGRGTDGYGGVGGGTYGDLATALVGGSEGGAGWRCLSSTYGGGGGGGVEIGALGSIVIGGNGILANGGNGESVGGAGTPSVAAAVVAAVLSCTVPRYHFRDL